MIGWRSRWFWFVGISQVFHGRIYNKRSLKSKLPFLWGLETKERYACIDGHIHHWEYNLVKNAVIHADSWYRTQNNLPIEGYFIRRRITKSRVHRSRHRFRITFHPVFDRNPLERGWKGRGEEETAKDTEDRWRGSDPSPGKAGESVSSWMMRRR